MLSRRLCATLNRRRCVSLNRCMALCRPTHCRYRLYGSIKEQLESFLEGFHELIDPGLISIFDENELELLISGLPSIDLVSK